MGGDPIFSSPNSEGGVEMVDLDGSLVQYTDHAHRIRVQRDLFGGDVGIESNLSHISMGLDLNN